MILVLVETDADGVTLISREALSFARDRSVRASPTTHWKPSSSDRCRSSSSRSCWPTSVSRPSLLCTTPTTNG